MQHQLDLRIGKYLCMYVLALTKFNAKICNSCSIFDSNSAPDAAAINLVYYNAVMKNVTFINHIGSTMRVSNYQLL